MCSLPSLCRLSNEPFEKWTLASLASIFLGTLGAASMAVDTCFEILSDFSGQRPQKQRIPSAKLNSPHRAQKQIHHEHTELHSPLRSSHSRCSAQRSNDILTLLHRPESGRRQRHSFHELCRIQTGVRQEQPDNSMGPSQERVRGFRLWQNPPQQLDRQ